MNPSVLVFLFTVQLSFFSLAMDRKESEWGPLIRSFLPSDLSGFFEPEQLPASPAKAKTPPPPPMGITLGADNLTEVMTLALERGKEIGALQAGINQKEQEKQLKHVQDALAQMKLVRYNDKQLLKGLSAQLTQEIKSLGQFTTYEQGIFKKKLALLEDTAKKISDLSVDE